MWDQKSADELIPKRMQGGLKRYIEEGVTPGGFLVAVLENNLKEAFGRADQENQLIIRNYVEFLYNFAPGACWGSVEKVTNWIEKFSSRTAS